MATVKTQAHCLLAGAAFSLPTARITFSAVSRSLLTKSAKPVVRRS